MEPFNGLVKGDHVVTNELAVEPHRHGIVWSRASRAWCETRDKPEGLVWVRWDGDEYYADAPGDLIDVTKLTKRETKMKIVEVYHHNDISAFVSNEALAFTPRNYTLVARVEVFDATPLRDAFELTNHIDRPWPGNRDVVMSSYINPYSVRSTSANDILAMDGKVYRVLNDGFEEVK